MKQAILFPGQGSQYPGMGKTFYDNDETFRSVVDTADATLPYDLKTIMFTSGKVHETRYAQPALYVMGCALHEAFTRRGVRFDMAAGLSIGEYAALYARGVFDFKTGLDIVEHRATYMQKAAKEHETAMVAVRTDLKTAQGLIEDMEDIYISNYNMDKQVVLAGSKEAIETVQSKGKAQGLKRMVPLKTSGAFHTPYMDSAKASFEAYMKTVEFNEPENGLYLNVTGAAYENRLKTFMVDQMTHTVRLAPMLRSMIDDGLTMAVEAGPGKTLSTFLKKTGKSIRTVTCDEDTTIERIIENLRSDRDA